MQGAEEKTGGQNWDAARFEAMSDADFASEVQRGRRRAVGELLRPARLAESSTSQLQGAVKLLQEVAPSPTGAEGDKPYHMDALLVADGFLPIRRDILEHRHTEYLLPGGRGSTKSSFASLMLVELLLREEGIHALVLRQVAATLRDSVYAQICWAIRAQGVEKQFRFTPSKPEITCLATGQKIYFRGADDAAKIKSIKPRHGAIRVLWFEEYDQFDGEGAVRNIEQSALRGDTGGPDVPGVILKTYNPPRARGHWVNKAMGAENSSRLHHLSDYRSAGVPHHWLGAVFLERAEWLEKTDPAAFAHEYLGKPDMDGGAVFPNVVARQIPDEEIAALDRIYNGVDWGWYPDPWAFVRVGYLPAQRQLLVFDEARATRKSNAETAEIVKIRLTEGEVVVCDAAEPKSVGDWRAAGIAAQCAKKGPGSLRYSYKWLQSLAGIVIDPIRCPHTLAEFAGCEYEGDNERISERDNHHIDAVRYATERVWNRRGS